MKHLIISTTVLILLIAGWCIFFSYSHSELDELSYIIDTQVLPSVESENWNQSSNELKNAIVKWNKYRKKARFVLDNEQINEIDECFSRSSKYILAEDISNASGELDALSDHLLLIVENEELSIENIL